MLFTNDWSLVLSFALVFFIVAISKYAEYEEEDFGFSHTGALLTFGYAIKNGRSDIAFMLMVSVIMSVMWHATAEEENNTSMHFAYRFAVAALMLYTIGSLNIRTSTGSTTGYRTLGVAAAYLYSLVIVGSLDDNTEEIILVASVVLLFILTIARKYRCMCTVDVVGAAVMCLLATLGYMGNTKGHAMWHVFGSLGIAFALTAMCGNGAVHVLGLYKEKPPVCFIHVVHPKTTTKSVVQGIPVPGKVVEDKNNTKNINKKKGKKNRYSPAWRFQMSEKVQACDDDNTKKKSENRSERVRWV
jgi:hypothetical protein